MLSQEQIDTGNIATRKLVVGHVVNLLASGVIKCPENKSVGKCIVDEAKTISEYLEYKVSNIQKI